MNKSNYHLWQNYLFIMNFSDLIVPAGALNMTWTSDGSQSMVMMSLCSPFITSTISKPRLVIKRRCHEFFWQTMNSHQLIFFVADLVATTRRISPSLRGRSSRVTTSGWSRKVSSRTSWKPSTVSLVKVIHSSPWIQLYTRIFLKQQKKALHKTWLEWKSDF